LHEWEIEPVAKALREKLTEIVPLNDLDTYLPGEVIEQFHVLYRFENHRVGKPAYPEPETWGTLASYLGIIVPLIETKTLPTIVCLKCGEPASEYRNIDEHGICDDCADREYLPEPIWCTQFRNTDGSQSYCTEPFYKDNDRCSDCHVYIQNMEAETELENACDDCCPHCGKISPNLNYCTYCGNPIEKKTPRMHEMEAETQ